ncbi:MAG: PEP-CTERM sorting domain-containing protein [Planctomycetota bacterium]
MKTIVFRTQLPLIAMAILAVFVLASAASAKRILVDLGRSDGTNGVDTPAGPDVNGNHWNNYSSVASPIPASGFSLSNLIDDTGAASAIGLETFAVAGGGSFSSNGLLNGGLSAAASHSDAKDPDGPTFDAGSAQFGLRPAADYAIATVTGDYWFTSNTTGAGIKITGLNPSLTYDLDLFGTRDTNTFRVTRYTATGANSGFQDLFTSGADIGSDGQYDGNDQYVVNINGIAPTAAGEIDLVVSQGQFNGSGLGTFFYIGALGINFIPEPATSLLLCLGGATLAMVRRRN